MKRWLALGFALLALGFALGRIFIATPVDELQGIVQKIFYIHVSSAWCGFLGSGFAALFSLLYLIKKEEKWDSLAVSFAELGFVFISIVLATGPFWAKPIWGTFWTWDPRLTSTFILWLLLAAYFLIRATIPDAAKRRNGAAIIAILAAIDVPFIHVSVLLFRTLHPSPIVLNPKGIGKHLDPRMGTTLLITLFAFTLLFAALFWIRYTQIQKRHAQEAARPSK